MPPLLTARRRLVLGPVDEGLEQLELVRIRQGALPLALPGADYLPHHGLQLGPYAEPVLDDHRLEVVEPPLHVLHPDRGALQPIPGAHVEHQQPVYVADQGLLVEIRGEQVGVARPHAAVAAHIEVPAPLGGDDAYVLALGLGALPGAA